MGRAMLRAMRGGLIAFFCLIWSCKSSRDDRIENDLELLANAIDAYIAEFRVAPSKGGVFEPSQLIGSNSRGIDFLRASQQDSIVRRSGGVTMVDRWGHPYVVTFQGIEFSVRTLGPDGVSSSDDQVVIRQLVTKEED